MATMKMQVARMGLQKPKIGGSGIGEEKGEGGRGEGTGGCMDRPSPSPLIALLMTPIETWCSRSTSPVDPSNVPTLRRSLVTKSHRGREQLEMTYREDGV